LPLLGLLGICVRLALAATPRTRYAQTGFGRLPAVAAAAGRRHQASVSGGTTGTRRTGACAPEGEAGECGAVRGDTGSVVAGDGCAATSGCRDAAAGPGDADAAGWTAAGELAGA
jgi:hypothetical protein